MENDDYADEMIVSPSGKFVAGTLRSLDELVFVSESRTRTILAKLEAARALVFFSLSPSGDENYILTMAEEDFVVWDHICGTHITLPGHSELEGDSPRDWMADVSKNFLFAWSSKGILLVWEMQSFVLVHTYRPVPLSSQAEYYSKIVVHVSVDETWLLAHSYRSTYQVCVWDTTTWTLHAIIPLHEDHNIHYRVTVAFTEGETSIVAACDCGAIQK